MKGIVSKLRTGDRSLLGGISIRCERLFLATLVEQRLYSHFYMEGRDREPSEKGRSGRAGRRNTRRKYSVTMGRTQSFTHPMTGDSYPPSGH